MIKTLNVEKHVGDEHIHVNILDTPNYATLVFTWRYRKNEWSVGKEISHHNQKDNEEVDWYHVAQRLLTDNVDSVGVVKRIYPFSYPSDWFSIAKEWVRRMKMQLVPADFDERKWVVLDEGVCRYRNI